MAYRVWTYNIGDKVSVLTTWQTRAQCLAMILGRWGHFPPWAFISRARTAENFRRANRL